MNNDVNPPTSRGAATGCSSYILHPERVEAAEAAAIDAGLLGVLADLFKVFADPTRLRVLTALAASELCVCDLGAALGMSQSAVSHQLATLRAAQLVAYRREGKTVTYRLADDHVGRLLALGLEHAAERIGSVKASA